jgi:DNA-directed RNA polymerase specialized sigma24 family protein
MEGPKTNDVDPEKLIPAAIGGKKKALNSLMGSFWLLTVLLQICERAGRRFHLDEHELRVFVEEKLRTKIRTIKTPTDKTWCDQLKAWCTLVVRRRGIALARSRKRREDHWKRVSRENVISKISGEEITASRVETPLEDLMNKEQERLQQRRKEEVRSTAAKVVNSFPDKSNEKKIGKLWLKGKSTRQISRATSVPVSSVYRILGEIGKAIVAEMGAKEALAKQPRFTAGLQKLVAG